MPKRIVVPLDRSDFAESALPYALGLLDPDGTLALVSAVDPMIDPMGGIPNLEMVLQDAAEEYLAAIRKRLPDNMEVTTTVVTGSPVLSIKHFAEGFAADLVVLSTHGRGPMSRVWLGSVADGLLRRTSIPVLLVRPHETGDPGIGQPVDLPRRVTVAHDGSDLANLLIDNLDLLGGDPDTSFDLTRVVVFPHIISSAYLPHTALANVNTRSEMEAVAKDEVERVAAALSAAGRKVETTVLTSEFVGPAIVEHASESGADVIMMATHGRRAVERLLLGSVADKVVRESEVPVLVVPAHHE